MREIGFTFGRRQLRVGLTNVFNVSLTVTYMGHMKEKLFTCFAWSISQKTKQKYAFLKICFVLNTRQVQQSIRFSRKIKGSEGGGGGCKQRHKCASRLISSPDWKDVNTSVTLRLWNMLQHMFPSTPKHLDDRKTSSLPNKFEIKLHFVQLVQIASVSVVMSSECFFFF